MWLAVNFLSIRAPSDLGPCVDGLVEQVEGAITVPQHQLQRGFFVEGNIAAIPVLHGLSSVCEGGVDQRSRAFGLPARLKRWPRSVRIGCGADILRPAGDVLTAASRRSSAQSPVRFGVRRLQRTHPCEAGGGIAAMHVDHQQGTRSGTSLNSTAVCRRVS